MFTGVSSPVSSQSSSSYLFSISRSIFILMSEFQMAILFPFVPLVAFVIVELLLDITSPRDDDDDNHGGGKMIPITVPTGA